VSSNVEDCVELIGDEAIMFVKKYENLRSKDTIFSRLGERENAN
jgi:hypothetical protein